MAHFREWSPPPMPFPLKCNEESVATGNKPSHDSMTDTVSINGRRILLCSFNGVVFQVRNLINSYNNVCFVILLDTIRK